MFVSVPPVWLSYVFQLAYQQSVILRSVCSCMVSLLFCFPLGMGTTRPTFQSEGNLPVDIEMLNNVVSCGAMLIAVIFNIFPEIPSLPTSRLVNSSCTPSSVHSNSKGQSVEESNWESREVSWMVG